jgi:hypothetical protein
VDEGEGSPWLEEEVGGKEARRESREQAGAEPTETSRQEHGRVEQDVRERNRTGDGYLEDNGNGDRSQRDEVASEPRKGLRLSSLAVRFSHLAPVIRRAPPESRDAEFDDDNGSA